MSVLWGLHKLRKAITHGDLSRVKALLDAGVDPNEYVEHHAYPLQLAVDRGDLNAVRLLLDAGADAGKPAQDDGNIFYAAVAKGRYDMADAMLEKDRSLAKSSDREQKPFHYAICRGDIAGMKYLLDHGANPLDCASGGDTSLFLANLEGQGDAIRFLAPYFRKAGRMHGASRDVETWHKISDTEIAHVSMKTSITSKTTEIFNFASFVKKTLSQNLMGEMLNFEMTRFEDCDKDILLLAFNALQKKSRLPHAEQQAFRKKIKLLKENSHV